MSEDGQFLMMSHQTAGQVSIFDVINDKVVHVINTPTPRSLLSRGDQLYVASFDEARISVYSANKGWSLQNELQVTKPNIVYMAAACAENFAGEILVTCHGPGNQASYQDPQVYRVDAGRDRCDPVARSSMASVSFDGKNADSRRIRSTSVHPEDFASIPMRNTSPATQNLFFAAAFSKLHSSTKATRDRTGFRRT